MRDSLQVLILSYYFALPGVGTGQAVRFSTPITFEYMNLICTVHIFYRDFLEAYERPKGESETGENDDLSQEGEHHFWSDPCNTARAKVPDHG